MKSTTELMLLEALELRRKTAITAQKRAEVSFVHETDEGYPVTDDWYHLQTQKYYKQTHDEARLATDRWLEAYDVCKHFIVKKGN